MRALIVDGTNLFSRHYAANPSANSNGEPIGGLIGSLRELSFMVRNLSPQIVYFVWDGAGGSKKKRTILKDYKKGRKPIAGRSYEFLNEESQKRNKLYQSSKLKNFIDALGICQITSQGSEADDIIGYIALYHEYFGHSSNIVVTCDKDFYQIINKNTVIYNPQSKKIIDKNYVINTYGIHPNNWLFFKCINGDSSDNIKGVKGFGPKTVCKLFPVEKEDEITLEVIDQKLNALGDKPNKTLLKRLTKLKENLDLLERNWKLMSLKDPLISNSEKDKITNLINDFKPVIDEKRFYIEVIDLGGAVDSSLIHNFKKLEGAK